MSRLRKSIGYGKRDESGFTLIEMLIVVGIIVALAAAIVPQVVQFGGKGEEGQKASELSTVQTAMDNMMASNNLTALTAEATARKDWETYPTDAGAEKLFTGAYLRVTSTEWGYCWNTTGKVSQTDEKTDVTCP